jgi:hypothetical protein
MVLGVTLPDTTAEFYEHISYLSKDVDPQGYVRSVLGIKEHLTKEQKDALELFVIE